MALLGRAAAGAAGCALLGQEQWRLFRHARGGLPRPGADEGRLRRAGTISQLRCGDEPASLVADHGSAKLAREGGPPLRRVCHAAAIARPGGYPPRAAAPVTSFVAPTP